MKANKVQVQKGERINPDPITMAMQTFEDKVNGDKRNEILRRSGQKPILKTPRQGR